MQKTAAVPLRAVREMQQEFIQAQAAMIQPGGAAKIHEPEGGKLARAAIPHCSVGYIS